MGTPEHHRHLSGSILGPFLSPEKETDLVKVSFFETDLDQPYGDVDIECES